jgi:hypothetical protein
VELVDVGGRPPAAPVPLLIVGGQHHVVGRPLDLPCDSRGAGNWAAVGERAFSPEMGLLSVPLI